MTIIGIDDTDSATEGMCTTFIGHRIASELRELNEAVTTYLIRLNPAAKHKTRGNAAVAIHTTCPVDTAGEITTRLLNKYSCPSDPETNPGGVIIDESMDSDSKRVDALTTFTNRAMHELLDIDDVLAVIDEYNITTLVSTGNGRGRIGATAALAAHNAFNDFTYECISYRDEHAWGTERDVNEKSVADAHAEYYPCIWDNYDPVTNDAVCVPHTPCPVLHGVRGDDIESVLNAANMITGESVIGRQVYITNQGTDAHIKSKNPYELHCDTSYVITGTVVDAPETVEGGHVFFTVKRETDDVVTCAAFEPTKRFRDDVRCLREGDVITMYGEYSDETLKLEKFSVDTLNETRKENPYCDDCEKSMSSMGADQGYRCSSCKQTKPEKVTVDVSRDLVVEEWCEVPPVARRHLAKPVIRFKTP